MRANMSSVRLEKLYYRIGEVADIVGVEPHVLRYWESEFKSIRPQKSSKGQRVYTRRDVERLQQVKELLYAHRFTIAGAKRKLREGGVEPAPTPPNLDEALAATKIVIAELEAAREEAVTFLAELNGLRP